MIYAKNIVMAVPVNKLSFKARPVVKDQTTHSTSTYNNSGICRRTEYDPVKGSRVVYCRSRERVELPEVCHCSEKDHCDVRENAEAEKLKTNTIDAIITKEVVIVKTCISTDRAIYPTKCNCVLFDKCSLIAEENKKFNESVAIDKTDDTIKEMNAFYNSLDVP